MKQLHEKIKCPCCGSNNVYCSSIEDAKIWDDSVHESYFKDEFLSEDYIIYKAQCEDCNKHFNVYLQLKNIEAGDMIIDSSDISFTKKVNYRKFGER